MKKPEILAPAGEFICLQAALDAGADAIYFGIGPLNMRARSGSGFTVEDLPELSRRCHSVGVKAYQTINTIVFDDELEAAEKMIIAAAPYVDAFIVSDLGVVELCKKHGVEFHISTQMSVSNSSAARFLKNLGASRIVLARECTLKDISKITSSVDIDIECFVHGAQCVAVSGRCFMSHEAYGASACRGECNQPCRRRYLIQAVDMDDDGVTPIDRGDNISWILGAHTVMSARDLCSLGFVDKLIDAGIASFKIEGRARNADYVKTVTSAYRRAVDAVFDGTYDQQLSEQLVEEVKTVFNRGFSKGMYFGRPGESQFTNSDSSLATTIKREIGRVVNYYPKIGVAHVEVLGYPLKVGDEIRIHGPTTGVVELTPDALYRDNESLEIVERGGWATFKAPKCRVGDKVFYVEHRQPQ